MYVRNLKEKGVLDQEIPLTPDAQKWVTSAKMQHDFQNTYDKLFNLSEALEHYKYSEEVHS